MFGLIGTVFITLFPSLPGHSLATQDVCDFRVFMTLLIAELVHEVAHDRGYVVATGEAKRGQHCVILALDLRTCVYEVRHGLGSLLAEYVWAQRFARNLSIAGFLDSDSESWTASAIAEAGSDLTQIDRRGVEFLRQFIAARGV